MPPRRPADVEKALVAKGMVKDENHHHMFRKELDGVASAVTRISHGSRDIGDNLASLMARQCFLRRREFDQLIECTLDEAGWDALIRERAVDGRNPFF